MFCHNDITTENSRPSRAQAPLPTHKQDFGCAGGGRKRARPQYKRYTAEGGFEPRALLARSVYGALSIADKALADAGKAKDIKWKDYPRKASPLSAAAKYARDTFPDVFGASTLPSLKKTAQKWIVASCDEKRLHDVKRRRTLPLEDEDWTWLRDVLTVRRWEDPSRNQRRHPDLVHAREHWLSKTPVPSSCRALVDKLDGCQSRAGVTLSTLTTRVRDKFQLARKLEKFKPRRPCAEAQACAERFLGHTALVEHHFSGHNIQRNKKTNQLRPPPLTRQVHYRTPLSTYERAELGRDYNVGKLHLDQGAAHITAAIDGASVFASGDITYDAKKVHYAVRCPPLLASATPVHACERVLHAYIYVVVCISMRATCHVCRGWMTGRSSSSRTLQPGTPRSRSTTCLSSRSLATAFLGTGSCGAAASA